MMLKFLLLTFATTCFGAALEDPTDLFTSAWEFQNSLRELQDDINQQLFLVRTSVSDVLRTSTNITLGQVEDNFFKISEEDNVVHQALSKQDTTHECFQQLVKAREAITNVGGFNSANKLRVYDKAVAALINNANADLEKYNAFFSDVQQIVVKAFTFGSIFVQSAEIQAQIQKKYKTAQDEWAKVRPDISKLIVDLRTNINKKNEGLGTDFLTIQKEVQESYNSVVESIDVCLDYINDVGAYVYPRRTSFFNIESFLPKMY